MSRFRLLRYKPASNPVADAIAWRALTVLIGISTLVVPASIGLCVVLAWISGQQYNYQLGDWQRCLVAPNTALPGTSDSQQLPGALATFAGKTVVFLLLAFQATALGIRNHDVLPYSIFASFFATSGILLYRESSPIQPEPAQMSPTLITLTYFTNSQTFQHLAYLKKEPQGICDPATRLLYAFLGLQYAMLAIALLVLCVALYTAYNSPRSFRLREVQLTSNKLTIVLALVTMAGFFVTLIAKEIVAIQTIGVLQESNLNSLFVFKKAELDVITLTMMATCGVILVGSFQECLVKFYLAAFIALMHVVLSCPVLIATFAAYSAVTYPWKGPTYSMWNLHECEAYVAAKNYPQIDFEQHSEQLRKICRQVPATLVGQVIIASAIFLQVLACLRVIYCNLHFYRPLEETRCRCCANRREDRGSFAVERVSSSVLGLHGHQPSHGSSFFTHSFTERLYRPISEGDEKEFAAHEDEEGGGEEGGGHPGFMHRLLGAHDLEGDKGAGGIEGLRRSLLGPSPTGSVINQPPPLSPSPLAGPEARDAAGPPDHPPPPSSSSPSRPPPV